MADVSQIVSQVLVEVDPSAGIVKLSARDGVGPPPLRTVMPLRSHSPTLRGLGLAGPAVQAEKSDGAEG